MRCLVTLDISNINSRLFFALLKFNFKYLREGVKGTLLVPLGTFDVFSGWFSSRFCVNFYGVVINNIFSLKFPDKGLNPLVVFFRPDPKDKTIGKCGNNSALCVSVTDIKNVNTNNSL